LAGVGLCSGLLVLYRDRFNSSGRISKLMAQNSFGIYFLHAPLVVAVTQTFDWLRLPPIPKAAVMIRMAFVTVLAFVHL
jgi:peptidoglycan/LPS O-acetylase OafA/YrhL